MSSPRFYWTHKLIFKATIIVSVQAVLTLVNFSFLLPAYTRLGKSYLGSETATFLTIMIFSSLVLIAGSILLGASATITTFLAALVIYVLGEGLPVATQAYIASLIEKRKLARVLSVLSIATTGGKMVASGIFPKVLGWGLDSGVEILKGLPFFESAVLFLIAAGAIGAVGWRERKSNGKEEDEEQ